MDGDDEAIGRLMRLWGEHEGLAERQVERMRELWLSGADHGFHLAVDTDDHPVGMVNLTPLDPVGAPALEPLLQQHADTLLDLGGSVVGMMAVEPRAARAQAALVRHILTTGIMRRAARRVHAVGPLPGDVGALRPAPRGRHPARPLPVRPAERPLRPHVHRTQPARVAAPDAGPVRRGTGPGGRTRPHRAAGPTQAGPDGRLRPAGASTVLLREAVEALASSASAVDAEAGEILRLYYLSRAGGHDLLAHRLHLSRATYFRRLEYGIGKVAEAVGRALDPP